MHRYKILNSFGDGSFGQVFKAQNVETKEEVAIKKVYKLFATWEDCLALREVASLTRLKHPGIVRLKELVYEKQRLFFILECMDGNLWKRIEDPSQEFDEARVKNVVYQLLAGLAHAHQRGYFHRDVKPENVLFRGETYKLCDFGQARETRSRPPYTAYVSTRWYRAPEVLLRSPYYNSPIDLWAIGCIMTELYIRKALFPGSSELDQLYKIIQLLGTPTMTSWPAGVRLAAQNNVRLPQMTSQDLSTLVPTASPKAISLIEALLQYDPDKRITAAAALKHEYFAHMRDGRGSVAEDDDDDYAGKLDETIITEVRPDTAEAKAMPVSPPKGLPTTASFRVMSHDDSLDADAMEALLDELEYEADRGR